MGQIVLTMSTMGVRSATIRVDANVRMECANARKKVRDAVPG